MPFRAYLARAEELGFEVGLPRAAITMLEQLDLPAELSRRANLKGVVIALDRGWPGASHLRFAAAVRKRGLRRFQL